MRVAVGVRSSQLIAMACMIDGGCDDDDDDDVMGRAVGCHGLVAVSGQRSVSAALGGVSFRVRLCELWSASAAMTMRSILVTVRYLDVFSNVLLRDMSNEVLRFCLR